MRAHTKIYFKYFGYSPGDFIPSELSGLPSVDVNHIDCRGMGGNPSKDKDVIENLIALTRKEHEDFGDKKQFRKLLIEAHRQFMTTRKPYFENHDCWDIATGERIN